KGSFASLGAMAACKVPCTALTRAQHASGARRVRRGSPSWTRTWISSGHCGWNRPARDGSSRQGEAWVMVLGNLPYGRLAPRPILPWIDGRQRRVSRARLLVGAARDLLVV